MGSGSLSDTEAARPLFADMVARTEVISLSVFES